MTLALPLLTIPTLEQAVKALLARLPSTFPVNNVDEFARFGTWVDLAAQASIDARTFTVAALPQGFALTATSGWLDLHAGALALARIVPGAATGQVRFITAITGTIPAGTVVQAPATATGLELRYLVAADTEISAPSALVPVVAEGAGTAYNVGAGRITTLVTLLPFVQSVSNDADWLTTAGVDAETDAQLRERLLLRWPAVSRGTTYRAYVLQAREVPGILKVIVDDEHPRGQGTVNVYVAPASGAPTQAQVQAAQALCEERRPVTADVLVLPPTLQPVDVTLTVYTRANVETTIQEWAARVQEVIDALGIGDTLYPSAVATALTETGELLGVDISDPPAHVAATDQAHLVTSGVITVTVQAAGA